MAEIFQFGALMFDDPADPKSGWYAVAGGEPVRVSDTSRVPSDILCLTNLDRETMYKIGLANHARFRHDAYLPERAGSLLGWLGVDPEDAPKAASVLSGIFHRVMTLAIRFGGLDTPPPYSLEYGLRQKLAGYDPLCASAEQHAMLTESVVHMVRCETGPYIEAGQVCVCRFPKTAYALRLLNTEIPSFEGEWRLWHKTIDANVLLEMLLSEQPGAVLAKVTLKGVLSPEIATKVNFGSCSLKRFWVALPDLLMLLMFGEVEVHKVYRCDDTFKPMDTLACLSGEHRPEPEWELSVSASLWLEAVWLSLCRSFPPPAHVARGRKSANPAAPFLKGIDRHFGLTVAIDIEHSKRMGTVVHYGKGKIGIAHCDPGELAAQFALLPPQDVVTKESVEVKVDDDILTTVTQMYLDGDTELIVNTDQLLFETLMDGSSTPP